MKTDKSGCATQVVDVTQFNLNMSGFRDSFLVQAEMEEYGTGKLEIEEKEQYRRRRWRCTGQVRTKRANESMGQGGREVVGEGRGKYLTRTRGEGVKVEVERQGAVEEGKEGS